MAVFSIGKRVFDSSSYRRNANFGFAFRVSGFLYARDFSSVGDTEDRNEQNHDALKAELVQGLLHRYGFTPNQITKVSKSYRLYSMNEEKLSQKLRFFRSILGSEDDVARVVTANPRLLASSLKNHLIPSYEFIKTILKEDILVSKSIKRSSRILIMELGNLVAKVAFLKGYGFRRASISKLMEYSPSTFALSSSKLEESLRKAKSLGFEPSNPMIVSALRAISQISESNWNQKLEVYTKWGWSSDEFLLAFKKQPFIMCVSEEKINKGMDIFVNRFSLCSSDIAKHPNIIFFSIEDRIIPRCSVIALLASKGILEDRSPTISTYYTAIIRSEEYFVKRFVDKYPEHVLELWQNLRRIAQL